MKKQSKRNRLIVSVITLCMAVGITPMTVSAIGNGGTGARSATVNGNVFLGGDYIELGIAPVGSFGTTVDAPTSGGVYFHPSGAQGQKIGMVTKGEDGNWNSQTTDFFMPGTVDEAFSIGWNNKSKGYGFDYGGTTGITSESTIDLSTEQVLKAKSIGIVEDSMNYEQIVEFGKGDKYFTTTVTLRNTSESTLTGVRYMRAFDPDQSKMSGATNEYSTTNLIGNATLDDFGKSVIAYGGKGSQVNNFPEDRYANPYIFFSSDLRAEVAYYNHISFKDLYNIENTEGMVTEAGVEKYVDGDILIYFDLGDLAPGDSTTFSWISSLDTDMSSAIEGILSSLNAGVDYTEEKLTGLTPEKTYKIEELDADKNVTVTYTLIADADGCISMAGTYKNEENEDVAYDLTGKTFNITELKENGEAASSASEVTLAPRPTTPADPTAPDTAAKPEDVAEKDIETTIDSIIIKNPVQGQEYSIDGGETWKKLEEGKDKIVFDALESNNEYTVITRISATKDTPASLPSEGVKVTTQVMLKDMFIKADGYVGSYDSEEHSITVTLPETLKDATVEYSLAEKTEYSSENPTFTDASETPHTVYYRITKEGYYPAYGSATVTISKATPEVQDISATEITYGEELSASVITANATLNDIEVPGTFTWDKATSNPEYIPNCSDSNITKYAYTFTPSDTTNYKTVSGTAMIVVNKADQTAPTPGVVGETYKGQGNGKITNVTSSMEYRKVTDPESEYQQISGTEISGLAAGTYAVRYKADENHNASPIKQVIVAAGRQAKVTLPSTGSRIGYTVTASVAAVDYNGEVTITLIVKDGYTSTEKNPVTATVGTVAKQENGTYKITGIIADTTISVVGIVDQTAPSITGITNGAFYYTTQKFKVADAADVIVTINGETVTPDENGLFTIPGNPSKATEYKVVATDSSNNAQTFNITLNPIAALDTLVDEPKVTLANVKSSDKERIEEVKAAVKAVDTTNATEAEKAALQEIIDKCDELLEKIADTKEELDRIIATTLPEVSEVTSDDKGRLEELAEDIENLMKSGNLTEDEKEQLAPVQQAVEELLAKIAEVEEAIADVTESVGSYDEATVTSDDKEALEALIDELDKLIDPENHNVAPAEKAALEELKEEAEALLDKIAEVEEQIENITDKIDGYDEDTVKSSDKAALEDILEDIEELLAADNLTDEERSELIAKKKEVESLLDKIDEIAKKMHNLKTKEEIEDFIKKNKENLTEKEIAALNSKIKHLQEIGNTATGDAVSTRRIVVTGLTALLALLVAVFICRYNAMKKDKAQRKQRR